MALMKKYILVCAYTALAAALSYVYGILIYNVLLSSKLGGLIALVQAVVLFASILLNANKAKKLWFKIKVGNLYWASVLKKVLEKSVNIQDKSMMLFAVFAGGPICLIPWIRSVQNVSVTEGEWAAIYIISFWTVRIMLLLLAWPSVIYRGKNGEGATLHTASGEINILSNAAKDYGFAIRCTINGLFGPRVLAGRVIAYAKSMIGNSLSAVSAANIRAKKEAKESSEELNVLMENKKLRKNFSSGDVHKKTAL